ncbi:MAG: hypothetical protein ACXU8R_16455 [Xanthobacteraceae bacterium]
MDTHDGSISWGLAGASIAQSPSGPIRSFDGQFYTDFIGKGAHALVTGMPAQSVRVFKTAI